MLMERASRLMPAADTERLLFDRRPDSSFYSYDAVRLYATVRARAMMTYHWALAALRVAAGCPLANTVIR